MKFKTSLGKTVELTSERKKHIFLFHPDLKPHFALVEDVLLESGEVRISKSDPKVLLFYKYFDTISLVFYHFMIFFRNYISIYIQELLARKWQESRSR